MDFDAAARRLARDQNDRRKSRRPLEMSAKAKQDAKLLKERQLAAAAQRSAEQKQAMYLEQYFRSCEQALDVKILCRLSATSIHGQGDKIALPPSVLEQLTAVDGLDSASSSSPWIFRVAIGNPNYTFPASSVLQALKVPEEDVDDVDSSDSESDDENDGAAEAAYLDELDHKYLAYTHATVVEFTQEEGHVGLPEPIASALIEAARRKHGNALETFRTMDTASDLEADQVSLDIDDEKTPGHIAWGAFDLPSAPVEISLVRLPKGRGATLTPTTEAIHNGFYSLDDIKLVLEQSLIRTRATLTLGDVVHSWHRGKKYDLSVSGLRPSSFNAVVCLNTDLEVEFGAPDDIEGKVASAMKSEVVLNETESANANSMAPPPPQVRNDVDLPVEPEPDSDNVCLIQIRSNVSNGRRRFDTTAATIRDLFAFAGTVTEEAQFQLVTRYPRRVLTLADSAKTLQEAGITSRQELFMVERTII